MYLQDDSDFLMVPFFASFGPFANCSRKGWGHFCSLKVPIFLKLDVLYVNVTGQVNYSMNTCHYHDVLQVRVQKSHLNLTNGNLLVT